MEEIGSDPILRLWPGPQEERPLCGLYLDLKLHKLASAGEVLIYSNYITSLDGRISIRDAETGEYQVPGAIANRRDWRLYQELAAQSDVMITSARYFRQLAKGQAQDLLPVGSGDEYADLAVWRQAQGLTEQPAVAILSRSLDIPPEALDKVSDRDVYVFTTATADPGRIASIRAHGAQVVAAGESGVEGELLKGELAALGFRSVCMIAGPEVHATLLDAGVLDRLFLSQRHLLLAGNDFHTIVEQAPVLPRLLNLLSLYYDAAGGQIFSQFSISNNDEPDG